jgi:hypothetical protein
MSRWITGLCIGAGLSASAAEPPSPAQLDEAFAAAAAGLVRRAEASGAADLAATIRGWDVVAPADRQVAFTIPPRLERPAGLEAPQARAVWEEFVAARRTRAAGLYDLAVEAARGGGETGTDQRPTAALALVHRALRDDPDLARARAAAGWVRRGDGWVWPEAARRLDRGAEFDPAFGWLPRGRLARYRAGERYDRGRWMPAADEAARRLAIDRGRQFDSDHWEILSAAPLETAAALARRLEETRTVWLQVFGAAAMPPEGLARRLAGPEPTAVREPFAAVLCADRGQYVAELERLVPAIAGTEGVYWRPTQTAWFVAVGPAEAAVPVATVWHEATHQLCAEACVAGPLGGERCGFWALEAVACHMESIRPAAWGWTVGGPDAGRVPAARRLLVEEEFFVPLAELAALGREAFQADPRLARIYDQLAGLADFLMNGREGRYREAFVHYLRRVIAGTDDPDTLARLCGVSFAALDEEYRRHLSR